MVAMETSSSVNMEKSENFVAFAWKLKKSCKYTVKSAWVHYRVHRCPPLIY